MKFILNYIALFLKWPLIKVKEILHDFQEEPRSTIYIIFIVSLLIFAERLFLKRLFSDKGIDWSGLFSVIATIFILVGTIWTALGVVLSPKSKEKLNSISLDEYIQFKISNPPPGSIEPKDPTKEIVGAMIAASNFASSGLFLITLGSLILIIKEFY